MYTVKNENGRCCVADSVTGIVIEWQKGRFNETQSSSNDNVKPAPEGVNVALYYARKMREIGDYLLENFPELL